MLKNSKTKIALKSQIPMFVMPQYIDPCLLETSCAMLDNSHVFLERTHFSPVASNYLILVLVDTKKRP